MSAAGSDKSGQARARAPRRGWRCAVRSAAALGTRGCVLALVTGSGFAAEMTAPTPFDAVTAKLAAESGVGTPSSQIILGSEVAAGLYPFQVSLLAASVPKGHEADGHFCGGSLIAPTWVLTAAHCVTSNAELVPPNLIDVYAGSSDFSDGDRISLTAIVRHPDFVPDYFENDVALLHLARAPEARLRQTNRVDEIAVVDPGDETEIMPPGTAATITGWGTTEKSDFSHTLHAASIRIMDRTQCNRNILQKRERDLEADLGEIARTFRIDHARLKDVQDAIIRNAGPLVSDGMFCAGDPGPPASTRVADACQGDSGGPIFVTTRMGGYVQVGIISWGEGCGLPQLYGVYARLAKYADWIARTTRELAQAAVPRSPPP